MVDYHIELAIDWGTWKWVAAYAIHHGTKRVSQVSPLLIAEESYEVRMMATWIDDRFVHGLELQRLADKDSMLSDKIIDFFKLPLYSRETSEITRRVDRILAELPGNKTLDMLIEAHLRAVVHDAKDAIRRSEERMDFDESTLERMLQAIRVRITVPAMWPPDPRRRMVTAARAAGITTAVLALEPQCALAYLIHKNAQRQVSQKRLRKGDHILIADLGCGTGDFVMYQLEDQLAVNSKLHAVGNSSGELCGSFKVDIHLLHVLRERKGRDWYFKTCKKLGVSERDLDRRIGLAIDEAKRQFGRQMNPTGTIWGIGGEFETIQLTQKDIEGALDEVVATIMAEIDKHIVKITPAVIQVCGGFSKSSYLMKSLRAQYEPLGIMLMRPNDNDTAECFPVAIGALLRHDTITTPPLPSKYGFAMLQRQEFDKDLHRDSCVVDEDGVILSHKPWVISDPYEPAVDVVDDRIMNLVKQGTVLEPGKRIIKNFNLMYILPKDNPRITDDFVYLTKEFEDCSMAMKWDSKSKELVLRQNVHRWAHVDIPVERSKLEGKGFKTVVAHGQEYWELQARVTLRNTGDDLKIGFEILAPCSEKDSANGAEDDYSRPYAFRIWDKVWEATHSEFIE